MLLPALLSFFATVSCVSFAQARVNIDFGDAAKAVTQNSQQDALFVELPLDHFDAGNTKTFKNRYWVNDEFYKPGGPVILYDVGEADASQYLGSIYTTPRGSNDLPDIAQKFNGLLILWEHRYYGDSLPAYNASAPANPDDYAKYYQYLTFEQALEDVAVFAKHFSIASQTKQDLRPNSVPWVFVGVSYPGARAAWIRLRNPEVVYASLSSSGPVQAKEDFWEYFVAVERMLAGTSGYEGCLKDMHAFAQWATEVVDKKNTLAVDGFLKKAGFTTSNSETEGAWLNRKRRLSGIFWDPITDFQYYGLKGKLGRFCTIIKSPQYTNDTAATEQDLKDGVVAHYGLDRSLDILALIAKDTGDSRSSTDLDSPLLGRAIEKRDSSRPLDVKTYTWFYQTCIEFGYFQTGNPSRPTNIMPGFISVEQSLEDCKSVFGDAVAGGPNITKVNSLYGGWHLRTTNVLYTNGEYDPWRALSVASDVDPTTPGNILTTTIPAANSRCGNGTVFGMVIKNGLHGSDFGFNKTAVVTNTTLDGSSDADGYKAHQLFVSALEKWLPEYKKFEVKQGKRSVSVMDFKKIVKSRDENGASNGTVVSSATVTASPIPTPTPSKVPSGASEVGVSLGLWGFAVLGLGMVFLA